MEVHMKFRRNVGVLFFFAFAKVLDAFVCHHYGVMTVWRLGQHATFWQFYHQPYRAVSRRLNTCIIGDILLDCRFEAEIAIR